jgi:hypothetical protein
MRRVARPIGVPAPAWPLNDVLAILTSIVLLQSEARARDLDKRQPETLMLPIGGPDLDAAMLKFHLTGSGFSRTVEGVTSPQVLSHAAFARVEADAEAVRMGWIHTRDQFQQRHLATQIAEAGRDLAEHMDEETWTRLQPLLEQKSEDEGASGGGIG